MAIFTVTTNADSGAGSLRQAIADANADPDHDTIRFDPSILIIPLLSELTITGDLTIEGDAAGSGRGVILFADGVDWNRLFHIRNPDSGVRDPTIEVTISDLVLSGGRGQGGGAIATGAGTSLTLIDSVIENSISTGSSGRHGGAIDAGGTLNVINSTLIGNKAAIGGAVSVGPFVTATFVNATIHGNEAIGYNTLQGISGGYGGGIFTTLGAVLNVFNSTITGNSSTITNDPVADLFGSGGGGISLTSSSTLNMANTVVALNSEVVRGTAGGPPGDGDFNDIRQGPVQATVNISNSFIGRNDGFTVDSGSGNILGGGDPGLGPLTPAPFLGQGDPVRVRVPNSDSPLINAGSAALLPADIFDLDGDGNTGEPLPVDARGGGRLAGRAPDIGAVEFNRPPAFFPDVATAAFTLNEGPGTAVNRFAAFDPDTGDTLAFSIAGGVDADQFAIDAATGALSFRSARDFENPADADRDNVYQVVVRVTDMSGLSDAQAVSVTVLDVNEMPFIASNGGGTTATIEVPENSTPVTTVVGADPDGEGLILFVSGGADAGRFRFDPATGALSFLAAPDFEAPADADGDNVYEVVVSASDAQGGVGQQAISVRVTDVGGEPGEGFQQGGGPGETIDLSGSDTVAGLLRDFFGDTISGVSPETRFVVRGQALSRDMFDFDANTGVMSVDGDRDGTPEGSFTLPGDFSGGDFMVVRSGADTVISFAPFVPPLAEDVAVAPEAVNGIVNQDFLTSSGNSGFRITLREVAGADFKDSIGVYEIDEAGRIVDVRLLINDASANPRAVADITGVENGNTLGFFIIQDGADFAAGLRATDTLGFIDAAGSPATVNSGGNTRLALNGSATFEIVFHSFSASLNPDGLQHVLSGVEPGGEAITIGFEDLLGGGDRDYQDVVFTVDWIT